MTVSRHFRWCVAQLSFRSSAQWRLAHWRSQRPEEKPKDPSRVSKWVSDEITFSATFQTSKTSEGLPSLRDLAGCRFHWVRVYVSGTRARRRSASLPPPTSVPPTSRGSSRLVLLPALPRRAPDQTIVACADGGSYSVCIELAFQASIARRQPPSID